MVTLEVNRYGVKSSQHQVSQSDGYDTRKGQFLHTRINAEE